MSPVLRQKLNRKDYRRPNTSSAECEVDPDVAEPFRFDQALEIEGDYLAARAPQVARSASNGRTCVSAEGYEAAPAAWGRQGPACRGKPPMVRQPQLPTENRYSVGLASVEKRDRIRRR